MLKAVNKIIWLAISETNQSALNSLARPLSVCILSSQDENNIHIYTIIEMITYRNKHQTRSILYMATSICYPYPCLWLTIILYIKLVQDFTTHYYILCAWHRPAMDFHCVQLTLILSVALVDGNIQWFQLKQTFMETQASGGKCEMHAFAFGCVRSVSSCDGIS